MKVIDVLENRRGLAVFISGLDTVWSRLVHIFRQIWDMLVHVQCLETLSDKSATRLVISRPTIVPVPDRLIRLLDGVTRRI